MQLGIDDPVGWYESQPDSVIDAWEAYHAVEPIGCDWERHASVMAMLEANMAASINPHLEQQDRVKPRSAEEFLPTGFVPQKKRRKATLMQQLELMAKVFGGVRKLD